MKATAVIAVLMALVAVIGVGVFLALGNGGEDSTIVLEEAVGDDGILSDNAEKNIIDSIGKEDGSNVEVRITSERSDTASISSKLLKVTKDSGASLSFMIKGTSVKISNKTLNALNSGNVSFTVKEATVPKEYAELEGRPAYDLTLECGDSVVSSFSDHVQVSIPYKLKSGEKSGNLYVAYLGKTIERLDCTFKSDSVRFSTNHFSPYVIAYRHTDSVEPREIQSTSPSQWSYVGGDVGSFGVTDSKTPITESDMRMLWMVTSDTETSSSNWKTPSSSLCVDDKVYYYKGQDSTLYCVDVATGNTIAKAVCPSKTVYNMAITYGDGKVFAVTSTGSTSILYAFDAETLKQLFVSVPVEGGETQGTITYNDGKVFFGTYSGDYVCFSTEDKNKARSDEKIEPLWLLKHKGWYNATPAFFDDYIVLVQRGFDDMGAIAYFMDANTGKVIDMMKFDREYASSGATAYEGRVYIPLNRVHDRTITDPRMFPELKTMRLLDMDEVEIPGSTVEVTDIVYPTEPVGDRYHLRFTLKITASSLDMAFLTDGYVSIFVKIVGDEPEPEPDFMLTGGETITLNSGQAYRIDLADPRMFPELKTMRLLDMDEVEIPGSTVEVTDIVYPTEPVGDRYHLRFTLKITASSLDMAFLTDGYVSIFVKIVGS